MLGPFFGGAPCFNVLRDDHWIRLKMPLALFTKLSRYTADTLSLLLIFEWKTFKCYCKARLLIRAVSIKVFFRKLPKHFTYQFCLELLEREIYKSACMVWSWMVSWFARRLRFDWVQFTLFCPVTFSPPFLNLIHQHSLPSNKHWFHSLHAMTFSHRFTR